MDRVKPLDRIELFNRLPVTQRVNSSANSSRRRGSRSESEHDSILAVVKKRVTGKDNFGKLDSESKKSKRQTLGARIGIEIIN